VNAEWKLRMLKALVNFPLRLLNKLIVSPKPCYPQTQLLQRVHSRLMQIYRLECAQGVFDVPDGNFERLLRVTHALLTKLAEDDRYYRQWLGLFMILCAEEYQHFEREISPADIKQLCQEQWEISPSMLSDNLVAEFREEFARDVLSYYLHLNSVQHNEKPDLENHQNYRKAFQHLDANKE
jgi:hypothetical protein